MAGVVFITEIVEMSHRKGRCLPDQSEGSAFSRMREKRDPRSRFAWNKSDPEASAFGGAQHRCAPGTTGPTFKFLRLVFGETKRLVGAQHRCAPGTTGPTFKFLRLVFGETKRLLRLAWNKSGAESVGIVQRVSFCGCGRHAESPHCTALAQRNESILRNPGCIRIVMPLVSGWYSGARVIR